MKFSIKGSLLFGSRFRRKGNFYLEYTENFSCDALHYFALFIKFKKREKHLRRNVTFSKVPG